MDRRGIGKNREHWPRFWLSRASEADGAESRILRPLPRKEKDSAELPARNGSDDETRPVVDLSLVAKKIAVDF